jgi:putative endonuclease
MDTAYRVYVLENPTGRHYIGLSENVAKRLTQHNMGESKWTAKYGPWKRVWQSEALDLSAARKLENLLKRQKGGTGFYRITGLNKSESAGS